MKRVFTIIAAGLLTFFAASCVTEKPAIFDDSLATPPVLGSYEIGEDAITASYTPGAFNTSFNTSIAPKHAFAIVKFNGEDVSKTIASTEKDGKLSVRIVNLVRAAIALGAQEGGTASLELAIRATMQEPARDNGINGFVDSEKHIALPSLLLEIPEVQGNPWQDYTAESTWSLIGSIASTGNSWNADHAMRATTDGTKHVITGVKLATGDQFKIRNNGGWDDNRGAEGDVEPFVITPGDPLAAVGGGKNLAVPADGKYDIQYDASAETITVSEAFETWPGFDDDSEWSVIGNIPSVPMEWNKDISMITDGTWHVAEGVVLTKDDQFKFRKNQDWTENFGATGDVEPFVVSLDEEIPAAGGGKNLAVPEDGTYDLLVCPESQLIKVVVSRGGKSGLVGSDTPEPPAPEVKGWNVIGLNGDWENDVLATETEEGVWAVFANANEDTAFKWRKDGKWDEEYGMADGGTYELGVPFEAVAKGKDIPLAAGFYKIVLNLNDLTITVSNGDVYSLIGVINGTGWDTDFELAEANGVYTSDVVYISGGFKIRHNHSWADADTYGADGEVTVGTPFTAVQPGSDISIPEGNYRVQFTPATKEVLISAVEYELPDIDLTQYEVLADDMSGAETWGIIGPAVLDWNTDVDLQKIQDDPEIWAAMNVPFQAGSFKFRGNDEWGPYDLGGGTFALNTPIEMSKGGGDMTAERGVYTVYLYPTYGIAYLTEGSGDVPPPPAKPEVWSLIGTINGTSWDTDFDLQNTNGDVWKISNVAITESDEFKLRADHDWSVNVGGPEENDVSTIDANDPYGVYKPVLGTAFEAGGKNIRIGVAGNYNVTFDYAANTILIEEYKEFPEHLYIIGEAIGGWDWDADYIMEMNPVLNEPSWGADNPGQFYSVLWLPAGQGFKFCSQKAWSGDFWGLDNNDGYTEKDGNCIVDADGFYLIHIDCKNSIVHIEPARVYGIGACFGGWDEGVEENLFKADGKTLKATLRAGGNPRVYVASSLSSPETWWQREFTILDGKIAYRVHDEYAWPSAEKGQVMTFNFNEGTGSISGEGQKEGWGLIGWHSADSWSTNVEMTPVSGFDGWIVAQHIGAASGNIDFKFRIGGAWAPNIGAEYNTPKQTNTKIHCHYRATDQDPDTHNIHLNGNGLYDVYLNPDELICVILDSGTPFAIPAEWEQDPSQIKDIWGIIGDACEKNWNEDSATFDEEEGDYFVARNVSIKGAPASFKFRANHTWGKELSAGKEVPINEAFDLVDGTGGTPNTTIAADGVFDVYLAKDLKTCILKSVGQVEVNIAIDGDMSDWANVEGATTEGIITNFKMWNDDENFYFYDACLPGDRGAELWAEGATSGGYYYYDFDLDNDIMTGDYSENNNGPYEATIAIFPFGGTADAPVIKAPLGFYNAHGVSTDGIVCKGVITDSLIEIEVVIPRANFTTQVKAGDKISVYNWRSKGGNSTTLDYVVK